MTLKIVKYDSSVEHFVPKITEILNLAYRKLESAGMLATASQTDEATLIRLESGDSFIGVFDSKPVASITIMKSNPEGLIDWFSKEDVYFFTQFAVSPDLQGLNIGSALLKHAEAFALNEGAKEIALDTSDKAKSLVQWYKKRGYRFIDYFQLPSVSYRSIVLSKNIAVLDTK